MRSLEKVFHAHVSALAFVRPNRISLHIKTLITRGRSQTSSCKVRGFRYKGRTCERHGKTRIGPRPVSSRPCSRCVSVFGRAPGRPLWRQSEHTCACVPVFEQGAHPGVGLQVLSLRPASFVRKADARAHKIAVPPPRPNLRGSERMPPSVLTRRSVASFEPDPIRPGAWNPVMKNPPRLARKFS